MVTLNATLLFVFILVLSAQSASKSRSLHLPFKVTPLKPIIIAPSLGCVSIRGFEHADFIEK
jgi:hypothetical protein